MCWLLYFVAHVSNATHFYYLQRVFFLRKMTLYACFQSIFHAIITDFSFVSFQLCDFQVAVDERDRIIQELTDSLKQSIDIRDRLNERNEFLANELKETKASIDKRKWITERDAFNEPRLSETTIDLVGESDFDDDVIVQRRQSREIDTKPTDEQKKIDTINRPNEIIEQFKRGLNPDEQSLFVCIEKQFNDLLNDRVNDVKEKLHQEQMERAELDSEANRLKQILSNIKGGSTEVVELRTELDKIHKKEMENLRLYFERKCTDLEKQ